MSEVLTGLFGSKKFCALLVTLLALLATRQLGLEEEVATEVAREVVAVVAAFMVGQGLSDGLGGKERARVDAARLRVDSVAATGSQSAT